MAKNFRSTREFREAMLEALGTTQDKDVENEANYKSALLEALGVEHTRSDVVNFETFREKLVEGVTSKSEGGGGSSDLSTAKVTVINNDNTFPCILVASLVQEESGSGGLHINAGTITQGNAGFGTNMHTVVLYKGGALATFLDPDGVETAGFDIEGNIEKLNNSYFITGDCTITIQPA